MSTFYYKRNIRFYSFSTFIILLGILSLLPIYFMIITSMKPSEVYLYNKLFPAIKPVSDYYISIFKNSNLGFNFINSIIILISTLIPYLFIASASGFAFSKLKFPFRLTLLLITTCVMVIPQMVVGVQLYALLAAIGLVNTRLGLVLANLGYFTPYAAYLFTTFYRNIPDTLLEAAKIDGAGLWNIYTRIMLPLGKSMFVTIIIVGSQAIWNDLGFSLILLSSRPKRTLMAAVALLSGPYSLPVQESCAVLLVTALPMILLYIFFQKYIQKGILAGGIKE